MNTQRCPPESVLWQLLRAELDTKKLEAITAHLDDCEACQQRLDEMSGIDDLHTLVDKRALSATQPKEMTHLIARLQSQSFETEAVKRASHQVDLSFLQPSDDSDGIGKLGDYHVRRIIARGGMGLVMEAWEPALQRKVAIKVLAPALAASQEARERFMNEARAAAALEHENIMPIYAVKAAHPLPYLVMPFIKGLTLEERVHQEPALTSEEMRTIAIKVTRALEHAHRQGVIHRDLKPANILLDSGTGRVLLADFGLARVLSDGQDSPEAVISGTPQYMAPEQATDGDATIRSDLFSLGAVLYFLVCGRAPFDSNDIASLARKISEEPHPEVSASNPSIPKWFGATIDRLLEKSPQRRFPHATAVLQALQTRQSPTAPSRRWLRLAIASLAVVATLLVWSMLSRETHPFRVDDQGRYASLAEALSAATTGSVVTIERAGPWKVQNLSLAHKDLILRAKSGVAPILHYHPKAPVIRTSGRLWLEGLTFTHAPDTQSADIGGPVIEIDGGQLIANHCRFNRAFVRALAAPSAAPAIKLRNGALELRHCLFVTPRAACLQSVSEGEHVQEVIIHQCALIGRSGLAFAHPDASTLQIQISSTLFHNQRTLFGMIGHQRPPFIVHARDSIFDFNRAFFQLPTHTAPKRMLSWHGYHNVFSEGPAFVSVYRRAFTQERVLRHTLAEWLDFAMEAQEAHAFADPIWLEGGERGEPEHLSPGAIRRSSECQALTPTPGPRLDHLGPGQAWTTWLETEAAQAWRNERERAFHQGAPRSQP